MNKAEIGISPAFDQIFEKRLKAINDQGKKDAKRSEKIEKELAEINEKIKAKTENLERLKSEYLKLTEEELQNRIEQEISRSAEIQAKAERGEITLTEHQAQYRSRAEIRKHERDAFQKALENSLKMIRQLDGEIRQLVHLAWMKRRDLQFMKTRFFDNKHHLLKSAVDEIAKLKSMSMNVEHINAQIKASDPDGLQAKIFECNDIGDLELIAASSAVDGSHLQELYSFIDETRETGLDFKKFKVQVTYRRAPSDESGMYGFSFLKIQRKLEKLDVVTTGVLK